MDTSNISSKVYKAVSNVKSLNELYDPGFGIFAKVPIKKGEKVCSFSGDLIDYKEAEYIDPTYIYSWQLGKGAKLLADDKDHNLGHYANGYRPDSLLDDINARFDKKSLKKTKSMKLFLEKRMSIDIIANHDIDVDEEIIIAYGQGYWKAMDNFLTNGPKEKPIAAIARDERAK
jgi:hypothetical protein